MKAEKNSVQIVIYENKNETVDSGKLCSFDKLCKKLESKNICIIRYSIEDGREQCIKNYDLWHLVSCAGIEMLPATYINGKIKKIEEYPTKKEVLYWVFNAK
jgi:hypothetical protein